MARKQILFGLHGRIVFNKPGPPVQHDFGTFVPTLQCGTTGGPAHKLKPSIVLTVTGQVGDISWCGLTWSAAEQGTKKEVCPETYIKGYVAEAYYVHSWRNVVSNYGLEMHRMDSIYSDHNILRLYRGIAIRSVHLMTLSGFTSNTTSLNSMIKNVPLPTPGNYQITDEYFGSFVVGGVTYTWARGTNW